MAYEMLIGVQVSDEDLYAKYRETMLPILIKFGGGFRYDFRISEVLKKETNKSINRVFTIHFSDQSSSEEFFSDPTYKKVKEQFLEKSIESGTVIASYSI